MPASGGSLSDTNVPTNKVVDGQSHYLAYITPDEGKSLMDQGGKETITDSGIPAYPPGMGDPAYGGNGSSSSGGGGGPPGGGDPGMTYTAPSQDTPEDVADTAGGYEDVGGISSRTNIEDIHGEWQHDHYTTSTFISDPMGLELYVQEHLITKVQDVIKFLVYQCMLTK